MISLKSFIITLLVHFSNCEMSSIVIINSNGSTIVGRKLFTEFDEKPFAAFWRIPYAVPPLQELRFKSPKRHQKWIDDRTYDFSKPYNDSCASGNKEDCLYLSIYMPLAENQNCTFPVIVWIHELSNIHGPDFFIDEDVVVVIVSYRTAILGFLNSGDDFAEGNMGAKDVLISLKWIRENIIMFNGDVNRVTVMGSGNGGNLVAALLLSPSAEDLFNRVVIQSGSALSPADYAGNSLEVLKKIFRKLKGHNDDFNRKVLYELLANASIEDLMSLSDLFDSTEVRNKQRLINSFGPTIEANKHAFMNKHPIQIYKRRMSNNNVDVIMGYTNLECLYKLKGFVKNRRLLKYLNYNFQYLLPFEGTADEYESKRYRKMRRKIMDFYFVNGTIGEQSLRRYAKYVSDQVIYPLLRQALLHSEASCNNVYLYRFPFKGTLNTGWDSVRDLNYSAATAGDEICYLFRCKSVNDAYRSAEANEKQFIKKIARLWANFAKCGNPTPQPNDDLLSDLKWDPLARNGELKGLNFGKTIKMVKVPEEKRMKFWDQLKNEFFQQNVIFSKKLMRDEL